MVEQKRGERLRLAEMGQPKKCLEGETERRKRKPVCRCPACRSREWLLRLGA